MAKKKRKHVAPAAQPKTAPETAPETAPKTAPETAPKTAPETAPETAPTLRERLLLALAILAALPGRVWRRLRRVVPRARTLRREHQAGHFPESDRRLIQLLLLVAGLFPMWRDGLRRRVLRLRFSRVREPSAWRKRVRPAPFAAAALVVAVGAAFFSLYTPATTVSYQGKPLETVRDGAEARRVAARVESTTAAVLGSDFTFEADAIQYDAGLARRSELGDVKELERELNDEIGLVTYGYTLYIDGASVGATEYQGALEALLDQLKQASVSEDTLTVDFVEDVKVVEGYIPTESLVNLGRIAETINSTKVEEVTYTVVKGDTWSRIAGRNDMTNEQLLALNPGYNADHINVGDVLVLSREVPYLTVRVSELQNYVESVEYDVIYRDDDSMYQGDTKVLIPGEYGKADIVAQVEYINGIETDREVISRVILSDPKPETRARGTKERPSWLPTGNFRWPCYGRITSNFGYRNTGIRGASTYHQGIDIACSYGTAIVAADGGTVEYTGYKGAMGYTVIINHGNGYKTYYEHCKSFACSAGQHVYKGQTIAYVGMSGVTSGAHCHFGVMKNGTYVNPLKYLP